MTLHMSMKIMALHMSITIDNTYEYDNMTLHMSMAIMTLHMSMTI